MALYRSHGISESHIKSENAPKLPSFRCRYERRVSQVHGGIAIFFHKRSHPVCFVRFRSVEFQSMPSDKLPQDFLACPAADTFQKVHRFVRQGHVVRSGVGIDSRASRHFL